MANGQANQSAQAAAICKPLDGTVIGTSHVPSKAAHMAAAWAD